MKYGIGLRDRLYIRYISLVLDIYLKQVFALLLLPIKSTRQMYSICLKVGRVTYLFCLNIVDVTSRYKVSIPIGAYSVKVRQGILTSTTIARALKKKYDDPECPLIW